MLSKGILPRGGTRRDWDVALRKYHAEQEANRQSREGLDLVQERAALARAQTQKIDFDLCKARGEFITKELVVDVLIAAASSIRSKLLSLPYRLKSLAPEIAPRTVDRIDDLIRELLMELSYTRLPGDVQSQLDEWQIYGKENSPIPKDPKRDSGNGKGNPPPAPAKASGPARQVKRDI